MMVSEQKSNELQSLRHQIILESMKDCLPLGYVIPRRRAASTSGKNAKSHLMENRTSMFKTTKFEDGYINFNAETIAAAAAIMSPGRNESMELTPVSKMQKTTSMDESQGSGTVAQLNVADYDDTQNDGFRRLSTQYNSRKRGRSNVEPFENDTSSPGIIRINSLRSGPKHLVP